MRKVGLGAFTKSMRKKLILILLFLSIPAVPLYQLVYYFNENLILTVGFIGFPLLAYTAWWDLYACGREGTRFQSRFGPIFIACIMTPVLVIFLSYLNQQGNLQPDLISANLIEEEYHSSFKVRGRSYMAYTTLEVNIDGEQEQFSIRVPSGHITNLESGARILLCQQKGLLNFTYYKPAKSMACR